MDRPINTQKRIALLSDDFEINIKMSSGKIISLEVWSINSPKNPILKLFFDVNIIPRKLENITNGIYMAPAIRA